jgi:hypothetical protein
MKLRSLLTAFLLIISLVMPAHAETTAQIVRAQIGAAASGSNSDITGLSGLIVPLSPGQGGSGSSTLPSSGQFPVGNAGGTSYVPQTLSGDGTLANTGAVTITKTGGVSFASSATTDTTNATNITSGTLPAAQLPSNAKLEAVTFLIDGSGATLSTGIKGDLIIPFTGIIQSVTLEADQSGSCVIDIWDTAFVQDTPPTVSNSIVSSDPPTLSSHQSVRDTGLSGWSKTITAGDIMRFNVNSATTITRVTVTLSVLKS